MFKPPPMTALALMFIAGCAPGNRDHDFHAAGLDYQIRELTAPRPIRIHILRVDLSGGDVELAALIAPDPDGVGPAEARLTNPLKLGGREPLLALINANAWDSFPDTSGRKVREWYEGQTVDIRGLVASGGKTRSPPFAGGVAVWVDDRGLVTVSDGPVKLPVAEGVAGFGQNVREGVVTSRPGGRPHPRTAVGVDRSGKIVWLVVVDGRQRNYSEGMTAYELACFMRDLGCWNAGNMDGGGSSIMALAGPDGQLRIANRPANRRWGFSRLRPVPVLLTVRRKSPR